MIPSFNIQKWYWIVAGSATQVYSSAAAAYILVSDPTYVAWLAAGNNPSRVGQEQDLLDYLVERDVAIPAGKTTSDAAKTARINRANVVFFSIAFNHENRIRVLEGKPAITKAQFIAAVKALIP